MFNEEQVEKLNSELQGSRVKTREKGNIKLSYLEGFDLIDTANLIFGFGNWSYSVTKLEAVSSEINQNQNHVICYKAIVELTIHSQNHSTSITREDVGFGTGVAKTLADANEGGAKEAVTDGLKRCMRSLGNQFGNSLYDKSKNHFNSSSSTNVPTNHSSAQTNQYNVQHQSPNQAQNQTIPTQQPNSIAPNSYDPYEYQSLYNIGLDVIEQQGFLLVTGDDIFSKKDSIKACGFRWDGKTKQWYKQLEYSTKGAA